MKKEIHPEYKIIEVTCQTCSQKFKFGTSAKKLSVDVCSNCHPFYTGNLQSTKATGRVERFKRMQKSIVTDGAAKKPTVKKATASKPAVKKPTTPKPAVKKPVAAKQEKAK